MVWTQAGKSFYIYLMTSSPERAEPNVLDLVSDIGGVSSHPASIPLSDEVNSSSSFGKQTGQI